MLRGRPQDDIAAFIIGHSRHAHAGKGRIRHHRAAIVFGIHKAGKVNIFVSPQQGAVFNVDVGSAQQHAVAGVHLPCNFNFPVGRQPEAL